MTTGEFNFLNDDLLDKLTELWTEFEKENFILPQTILRAEDAHQFLEFLKRKVEENRVRTCDNCVNCPDWPNCSDPSPEMCTDGIHFFMSEAEAANYNG